MYYSYRDGDPGIKFVRTSVFIGEDSARKIKIAREKRSSSFSSCIFGRSFSPFKLECKKIFRDDDDMCRERYDVRDTFARSSAAPAVCGPYDHIY